jgi:hypothetical protein
LEIGRSVSNHFLRISTTWIKTGPKLIWHVLVWVSIFIGDWPLNIFSLNSIKELAWCRVHECDVPIIEIINEVYYFFSLTEVYSSVLIGEITAPWKKYMLAFWVTCT